MDVRLCRTAVAGVLATSLYACAYPRPTEFDDLDRALAPAPGPRDRDVDVTATERVVVETGALTAMIQLALRRNPELLAQRARVEEALARVPLAARRPDLELKYEQSGVPLARPYALRDADTLMVGVRQTFPAPGSLDAQQRAAAGEAEVALYALRARELEIVRQVEQAYLAYHLADREQAIHREHVELAQQIIELTRSNLRAGTATQQDALRVAVQIQALHRDIAALEQRRRSALALLGALMGRSASTAPTPAPVPDPAEVTMSLDELQRLAARHRPEVAAAARAIERGRADVDAARSTATWPSVMVGVDYMYMPFMEERHAYGAMLSINLPWLNGARWAEVRAAERAVDAERRGADAAAVAVRYEVEDAFARYRAARASHEITRRELLPGAQQSFEVARSGVGTGRTDTLAVVDALRTLLDVELEEVRERFALSAAIADLERAVGAQIAHAEAAAPHGDRHE